MSYIYTLENGNIELDEERNSITNIIAPLVNMSDDLIVYPYIVSKQEEMRIDLILSGMYGENNNYIDEILTLNNIIDPLSLVEGTILWYPDSTDLEKIRKSPIIETDEDIINRLIDPNSERKIDYNRETGMNLTPTIMPSNMKQIDVDTKNNIIKINNKLK
jgi:hypothetical protein